MCVRARGSTKEALFSELSEVTNLALILLLSSHFV